MTINGMGILTLQPFMALGFWKFPRVVQVDVPAGLKIKGITVFYDGFGQYVMVVVACAPLAIAVGIQEGLKFVFARGQVFKHDLLSFRDGLLFQHLAVFVGELHDHLLHSYGWHHGDVDVAVFVVFQSMGVGLIGFVGAATDAKKHRVGDFDLIIGVGCDWHHQLVLHTVFIGRFENESAVADECIALKKNGVVGSIFNNGFGKFQDEVIIGTERTFDDGIVGDFQRGRTFVSGICVLEFQAVAL